MAIIAMRNSVLDEGHIETALSGVSGSQTNATVDKGSSQNNSFDLQRLQLLPKIGFKECTVRPLEDTPDRRRHGQAVDRLRVGRAFNQARVVMFQHQPRPSAAIGLMNDPHVKYRPIGCNEIRSKPVDNRHNSAELRRPLGEAEYPALHIHDDQCLHGKSRDGHTLSQYGSGGMGHALALGRAEISACQRRTLVSSSDTVSFAGFMRSTATSPVISATL